MDVFYLFIIQPYFRVTAYHYLAPVSEHQVVGIIGTELLAAKVTGPVSTSVTRRAGFALACSTQTWLVHHYLCMHTGRDALLHGKYSLYI